MSVTLVNPDSVVLAQVAGYWEKLFAMLVFKLAPTGVTLTLKDMEHFRIASESGNAVLLTHGHYDSIEFKIVTQADAERLAAHDAAQKGSA